MKKYYKGNLKDLSHSDSKKYSFGVKGYYGKLVINKSMTDLLIKYGYSNDDIAKFEQYVNADGIQDYSSLSYKKQWDIVTKVIKNIPLSFNSGILDQIIFEIVKSSDGSMFAKEINTGLLFPIKNNNVCVTSMKLDNNYDLIVRVGIDVPEMNCINTIITSYYPASQLDIENYNKKNSTIEELYKTNSFSKKVELINYEENSIDNELIACSKILSDLDILKTLNEDKYNSYKERYDKLIENYNSNNSILPIDINSLLELESLIKYVIVFYKDEDNNFIYIDEEIKKLKIYIVTYDKDILNECISKNEIIEMYNLFLKYQDCFNLKEKNNLLDKIACLLFYYIVISDNYNIQIDECLMNRIISYTKYLYDNNEINDYIKSIDTFYDDIENIVFDFNTVNKQREEKNVLLRLFKR